MEGIGIGQQGGEDTAGDGEIGAAKRCLVVSDRTGKIDDPHIARLDDHVFAFDVAAETALLINLNKIMIDAAAGDRLRGAPELDLVRFADAKDERPKVPGGEAKLEVIDVGARRIQVVDGGDGFRPLLKRSFARRLSERQNQPGQPCWSGGFAQGILSFDKLNCFRR